MAERLAGSVALGFIFSAPLVSWMRRHVCDHRSVEPGARLRLLTRVIALWAALFIAKGLVPHTPVFAGPSFDASNANWWESRRAAQAARPSAMPIPTSHRRGCRICSLHCCSGFCASGSAEQRVTDVYAIGSRAGPSKTFSSKEVDGALGALERSLPINGRSLRLINNAETVEAVPWRAAGILPRRCKRSGR